MNSDDTDGSFYADTRAWSQHKVWVASYFVKRVWSSPRKGGSLRSVRSSKLCRRTKLVRSSCENPQPGQLCRAAVYSIILATRDAFTSSAVSWSSNFQDVVGSSDDFRCHSGSSVSDTDYVEDSCDIDVNIIPWRATSFCSNWKSFTLIDISLWISFTSILKTYCDSDWLTYVMSQDTFDNGRRGHSWRSVRSVRFSESVLHRSPQWSHHRISDVRPTS